MKKYIIIGAAVVVFALLVYYFTRKKTTNTGGGTTAPAKLSESDFQKLETAFQGGNPYNADRVILAAEISAVGENDATPHPSKPSGFTKVSISKEQFDNMVLTGIRKVIRDRSVWLQQIEESRFDPYSGSARAGYNTDLARALAYAVRQDLAQSYYYTEAGQAPAPVINSPYGQPAAGIVWENTKIDYIKKATDTNITPNISYYIDVRDNTRISNIAAKTMGAI
jgi:hypothetical protein